MEKGDIQEKEPNFDACEAWVDQMLQQEDVGESDLNKFSLLELYHIFDYLGVLNEGLSYSKKQRLRDLTLQVNLRMIGFLDNVKWEKEDKFKDFLKELNRIYDEIKPIVDELEFNSMGIPTVESLRKYLAATADHLSKKLQELKELRDSVEDLPEDKEKNVEPKGLSGTLSAIKQNLGNFLKEE